MDEWVEARRILSNNFPSAVTLFIAMTRGCPKGTQTKNRRTQRWRSRRFRLRYVIVPNCLKGRRCCYTRSRHRNSCAQLPPHALRRRFWRGSWITSKRPTICRWERLHHRLNVARSSETGLLWFLYSSRKYGCGLLRMQLLKMKKINVYSYLRAHGCTAIDRINIHKQIK